MKVYPGAAAIATLLAGHGYRKGSLSGSGAIAAWTIGYGHLANPLKLFGVTMIAFYLIGSRATKYKAATKAKLEDGIDADKPAGNRNWVQVLSNSLPSLIAAVVYRACVGGRDPTTHELSRPLIFAALGHLSNALADTLASEMGILSSSPPRSILTLRPVPPGTNGGVSWAGIQYSIVGGCVMGLVMVLDLCVESANGFSGARSGVWEWELIVFGAVAGLAGSLLDSLLGATLQKTVILPNGKVQTDHSRADGTPGKQVGIGKDVLSNSGVNAVCGFVMAAVGYWYGRSLHLQAICALRAVGAYWKVTMCSAVDKV